MRKKAAAIFLILALLMVLFFQTAEGTTSLSETVRMWLENQMIESTYWNTSFSALLS